MKVLEFMESTNFLKFILFVCNFLFVLTGLIITIIGLIVRSAYYDYMELLDEIFFSIATFFIIIGTIIYFIAFFGCYGVYIDSYWMIITFSFLLLTVYILELTAGISGYVLRDETTELVQISLNSTMAKYGNPNNSEITYLWDHLQMNFDCCGLQNVSDWKESVPMTCCTQRVGAVNEIFCNANISTIRTTGCVTVFGNYIKEHLVTLGATGVAFAVIQGIGVILSFGIATKIKEKQFGSTYQKQTRF